MDKNIYVILSSSSDFKEPLSGIVHSVWSSKRKAYKELTMQCSTGLNELEIDLDDEEIRKSLREAMCILAKGLNDDNINAFYKYATIAGGGFDYSMYHGITKISKSTLNIDIC